LKPTLNNLYQVLHQPET